MQHLERIPSEPIPPFPDGAMDAPSAHYELRYRPLADVGRGFAFPCDARGSVVMDELSERSLANYLYARGAVGRFLQWPQVRRVS